MSWQERGGLEKWVLPHHSHTEQSPATDRPRVETLHKAGMYKNMIAPDESGVKAGDLTTGSCIPDPYALSDTGAMECIADHNFPPLSSTAKSVSSDSVSDIDLGEVTPFRKRQHTKKLKGKMKKSKNKSNE